MRNKKKLLTLLGGIYVFLVFAALPGMARSEAPAAHPTLMMQYLGHKAGTAGFILNAAAANIITKHSKWIKMTAVETIGGYYNVTEAAKGDPNSVVFNFAQSSSAAALRGNRPFKKKHTNIRYIAGLYESTLNLITLDPNIKTIADLRGKTITWMPHAWGFDWIIEGLLREYGLGDTVSIKPMHFSTGVDALRDGLVDATVASAAGVGGVYHRAPAFEELIASKGKNLHVIALDHKTMKKIYDKQGIYFGLVVVPPNTFGQGQPEPVEGYSIVAGSVAVFDSMDDEVAYELARVLAENVGEFGDYHKALGRGINKKSLVKLIPWVYDIEKEVHPGALRYYKEAQLWEANK